LELNKTNNLKMIKRILVLAIVCVLSGLVLSKVYNYANPKIIQNQKEWIEKAIFNIIPSAKKYESKKVEEEEIYFCYDKNSELIGYVFKTSGMGYQGEIVIMVGLDKNLDRVEGIEILTHSETPGLGAKIVEEKFKKQFKNLKVHPLIEDVKGKLPEKENQIQAITGATVTSKSVVNILNDKIEEIKQILKE